MRKWIASIISLLLLMVGIIPLTAMAGEKGKYAGKVSEISQENKSFKLIGTDKTWVVKWTEKTDFIWEGKKTTPDQLKNDVSILVIGIEQEEESQLEAIIVAWGQPPGGKDPGEGRKTPIIFGKMSQLNLGNKSFKIQGKDPKGNDVAFLVTYKEETKFVRDKQIAKPEDFKEGEEVTVAGKIDLEKKTIEAMLVVLGKVEQPKDPGKDPGEGRKTPIIFGKMSQLNLGGKSFKIQGKDPQGNEVIFQVTYKDETKFVRDKQLAKPEDFKEGEEITVAGKIDLEKKTIEAMLVVLGKVEQPKDPGKDPGEGKQAPMIFGVISRFNYDGKVFQLKTKDNQQKEIIFEVYFNKETKFFKDKKQVNPTDFKIGDEVTVAGKINFEKKLVEAILVVYGRVEQPGSPEAPVIKWEKDAIIREKFSVFNEETIDITYKTTITKDTNMKISVSEPWLLIKKDEAKLLDQKITMKIIGEKLVAWKTNTAVIKISFPEYPKLDKNIFISIDAIGNVVVVKIGSNKASVNMKEVQLDEGSIPLLKNGRTFVGIRFMGEIVFNNKAKITFDGKTQTVYFVLGSKKIELYIGKSYALVNGVSVKLDSPPFIQNGRTYVPLRFVGENLDATVAYDAKTQTITIVYPGR